MSSHLIHRRCTDDQNVVPGNGRVVKTSPLPILLKVRQSGRGRQKHTVGVEVTTAQTKKKCAGDSCGAQAPHYPSGQWVIKGEQPRAAYCTASSHTLPQNSTNLGQCLQLGHLDGECDHTKDDDKHDEKAAGGCRRREIPVADGADRDLRW